VDVAEEAPGVYRVVVEDEDGRRVIRVVARGGLVETPWGTYPVAELRRKRLSLGERRGKGESWLVETEGGAVRARLPVRVVQVLRRPGDMVGEGETVMVVETMKMLNELRSPCRGRVVETAEEGGGVDTGGILFRIDCG